MKRIAIILIVIFILLVMFFITVQNGYESIVKKGCTPCYYDINNIDFNNCCDSFHNTIEKIVIVFKYYIR